MTFFPFSPVSYVLPQLNLCQLKIIQGVQFQMQGTKLKQIGKVKLMAPVEPSRTSFSSSCSSSTFSSVDWDKKAKLEPSSSCQSSFPKTTYPAFPITEPSSSPHLFPKSLDIRDIVKDSMYKEGQGLSVKSNAKIKGRMQAMKHIDSPRPFQQHESLNTKFTRNDGSLCTVGNSGNAPHNAKQQKYGSLTMTSKDAPRYSYDERISQDKVKSTGKLKELSRLSLDSRDHSLRSSASQSRSNYLLWDIDAETTISKKILCLNQEPGSNKRPSTIVARLMGFEPTPDYIPTDESQILLKKDADAISISPRICNRIKQNQDTGSPIVSCIPGSKNDYLLMKSISRFPLEPAQWKLTDSNLLSREQALKIQEARKKDPQIHPSVYGEIQKRLTELEFKKYGKDLRALKQILEAMEKTREKSENEKEEHVPNSESHGSKCSTSSSFDWAPIQQSPSNTPTSPIIKGSSSPKRNRFQNVIMKPNKQTQKPANPTACKPVLRGKWSGDNANNIMELVDRRRAKDITPKRNHLRDASSWPRPPNEIKTKAGIFRSSQHPKVAPHMRGENHASYGRNSRNLGQRLQKKQGIDKLTCLTTPSSDWGKSRKQSIMHPMESSSSARKFKPKPTNVQQGNVRLNWSRNETRNLKDQGNTVSMQSKIGISLDSHIETEVTRKNHTEQITGCFQPKVPNKEDLTNRFSEDMLIAELAAVTQEHPSPVSVLDITIYEEDFPSPVKKRLSAFQESPDYDTINSNEAEWSAVYIDQLQNSSRSNCSSRIDQGKLGNVDHLVHKHQPVDSTQDEPTKNCIESVCDDNNSEHRYIAQILVAAGLLMDRGSSLAVIQLHPSELPLDPQLFHKLENLRGNTKPLEENYEKGAQSKVSEAIHRKLLFDVVNEILARKSALAGSVEPRVHQNNLTEYSMRGDKLFKELCSTINHQHPAPYSSLDDIIDGLTTILSADMIYESENWAAYSCELRGIVLDIERMIFKDLIGEVVCGGATGPQLQSGTRCRKLFPM